MFSREESRTLLASAQRIYELSLARWGSDDATVIVGLHSRLRVALEKLVRFARPESPILITGETGAGKELFARAALLCSSRADKPYLAVNCAQYADDNLVASQLFGHRKGAFTGASSDHMGIFEKADGGVVLLDEVGELSSSAQAMLLRVLGEGEIIPIGDTQVRKVDVRILAATNQNLEEMVAAKRFREDLYHRLRCLSVEVPSLRNRGDDWHLIARYYMQRLDAQHSRTKSLAPETIELLNSHPWPGNIRELKSVVEVGYLLSDSGEITIDDLGFALEEMTRRAEINRISSALAEDFCEQMICGDRDFWETIHQPYLDRELNRREVRQIVSYALTYLSRGSYKKMFSMLGVADEDYLKAMDFLRHHDLKPRG
jgi:transcriptional regulator with GAF, ATPase, and Fis domain